jgi:AAA domain
MSPTMTVTSVVARDRDVRRRVLETVLLGGYLAVVVDSPPGAGKTHLVETVVAMAAHHLRMRVGVIAPRVEQVHDLVRRLRQSHPFLRIQLLHASGRPPDLDILADPGVVTVDRPANLGRGPGVVVTTAAKLVFSVPDLSAGQFDLLVCDESYQLPWKDLAPVLHLAHRHLLVGDPGQLRPIVRGDLARYEAARHKMHWAAPRELLRQHPDLPRLALPATWRLPQDTVDLVQPSFYPGLPFASAVAPADRRLGFVAAGIGDPVDAALDQLASGATLVGLLLPARPLEVEEVDDEVAELAAHVVARLLERAATWVGVRKLTECDIGYVDAHVASNARTRARLRSAGVGPATMTTTPEIWQGSQRPVMVAKHTLSGLAHLDGFALDPGRLCVMTSRHQLGVILVGRDGVAGALERHRHDTAERPSGTEDAQWAGWRAHHRLWTALDAMGRLVRA